LKNQNKPRTWGITPNPQHGITHQNKKFGVDRGCVYNGSNTNGQKMFLKVSLAMEGKGRGGREGGISRE